jgi:hypothetical protein
MAKSRDRWVRIIIWVVVAMMVLTLMASLLPLVT